MFLGVVFAAARQPLYLWQVSFLCCRIVLGGLGVDTVWVAVAIHRLAETAHLVQGSLGCCSCSSVCNNEHVVLVSCSLGVVVLGNEHVVLVSWSLGVVFVVAGCGG